MLSERQQQILEIFLQQAEQPWSIRDLLPHFEVGRTSLFRDLSAMGELGLIQADSATRARTYQLNKQSAAYLEWDLSRPPYQRSEVRYNPKLLDHYRPNESYLLTAEQRVLLAQAGRISKDNPLDLNKNYTQLISTLLIDLAHASSTLENVPISWLDTKTLLEFGERPNGLGETELRIVLNHKTAINHLTCYAGEMQLSSRDLFDLHSLIADRLIAETQAIGKLRTRVIQFADSRYLPPDNPHLLKEAFEQFCEKANLINHPFEQAFFTMTFIPHLQPFQNGNKRTSRLAMNIRLLKNPLAPFSFTALRKRDYMLGLLAFYERGEHQFLANAFVNAYQKTAPRYAALFDHIQQGGLLGTLT